MDLTDAQRRALKELYQAAMRGRTCWLTNRTGPGEVQHNAVAVLVELGYARRAARPLHREITKAGIDAHLTAVLGSVDHRSWSVQSG